MNSTRKILSPTALRRRLVREVVLRLKFLAVVLLITHLLITPGTLFAAKHHVEQEPRRDLPQLAQNQGGTPPAADQRLSPEKASGAKPATAAEPGAKGEATKAEGAKELAENDEDLQFKRSHAVLGLARITHLSPQGAYWLSIILNFAVVAVFFAVLWKRSMPGIFRNRTSDIKKNLDEAQRVGQESAQRLQSIETRLARLDSEVVELRATAEADSKQEEERIRRQAEEEQRRMVKAATQEIESAAGIARRQLKAYAAGLAVSLAESKIHVTPADDQILVREFGDSLTREGQ